MPYKVIRTEYLILEDLNLIANVGGTLGLTVGFSFIATIEWLTNGVAKVWKKSWTENSCLKTATKFKVSIYIFSHKKLPTRTLLL